VILYDKQKYNCAHHAINRINECHNTDIHFADGDEWQVSFIRMMRKRFTEVSKPVNNCLVVMTSRGVFHLGFFTNWMIEHNYNTGGNGSVILSDIGTINSDFERVRYYVVN